MAKTLKERYESRILEEANNVSLMLEALDQQKIQEIASAIDALEKLIPQDKLPQFYSAVQNAKNELGKALSGGITTAAIQKITQPVSKAVALADGLKAGFRALPQLLKSFVPQQNQNVTDKPIQQVLDPAKVKQFSQAFLNAIRPTGVVASLGKLFSSGGGIPFLNNAQNAVSELIANMTTADLQTLAQGASSAPPVVTPEVAKEIQSASQTAAQPQQTQGAQASQSTQQVQSAAPAAQTAPTPVQNNAFDYIKNNIAKLSQEQQKQILDLLQGTPRQPFPKATD